jgi:CSLREA domain-containing protein
MKRAALLGIAIAAALLAPSAQAAMIEPNVLTDDLTNNGNCTLREAVEAATTNAAVDACPKGQKRKKDQIPLGVGDYTLASGDMFEDENAEADLDVRGGGPVSFVGRGLAKTSILAPSNDRALHVIADSANGSTRVSLSRLTMEGGGGALWGGVVRDEAATGSKLTLDRVRIRNGEIQFGGGIYTNASLRVKRSIFEDNSAKVSSTGFPGVHAVGGAVYLAPGASANITDTTFSENSAITNDSTARGGAIATFSGGPVVIRRSSFLGNAAYSSSSNIPSIREGGAIYEGTAGGVRVINSTFVENVAAGSGANARGGAYYGGGASDAELVNSTFLDNDAPNGSAMALEAGALTLTNSVIDPHFGGATVCAVLGGSLASGGYNVTSTVTCPLDGPGDKRADPHLANAPEDNGGPTKTVRLERPSPAIDHIPLRRCKPAKGEDQRRYKRPAGKRCDSGAYERGAKKH